MARPSWWPARRAARREKLSSRPRQGAPATSRRRPRFEPLEERRLLAITVNTLVDELDGSIVDGDVSLRDAIAAAPSGETINFDASLSGATITLNLGELVLDKSIKIDASSLAGGLTIDASGNDLTPATNNGDGSRVLRITDETPGAIDVELRGLTLTGGDVSGHGGAIQFRRAGSLTIAGSTLTGNSATVGGALWARTFNAGSVNVVTSTISGNASKSKGGGLYIDAANGTAEIRDSTISGNTAASDGGGGYTSGTVSILQNTVSGNTANWRGGGLFVNSSASSTSRILFSTITDNKADADANNPGVETGGGVFAAGPGALQLEHTIVAANVDPAFHAPDVKVSGGTLTTQYNLIGTNAGSGLAPAPITTPDANGNIIGGAAPINPGLAPLADNGGPTLTHALLSTSPAVNRGNPNFSAGNPAQGVPLYDQRGNPFGRVVSAGASRIDIGAVEFPSATIPTQFVVDTVVDEDDNNFAPGDLSLREAIRLANQMPEEVAVPPITFAPSMSGQTIALAFGQLIVTRQNLVIDASGLADRVSIDGGGKSRVLTTGRDFTLRGVRITGGANPNGPSDRFGGALYVSWLATDLIDCVIEGNSDSAIVVAGIAQLRIVDSIISGNTSDGRGSAIYAYAHSGLTIEDSQIVDNIGADIDNAISLDRTNFKATRTTISRNSGDGIAGGANVELCTISDNTGSGIVGGATVVDSSITGNSAWAVISSATSGGGGIFVSGSTLANNGGGISVNGGLNVQNSTISGNGNQAIVQFGISKVTIEHSTIYANTSGVYAQGSITHSIVAHNTGVDVDGNLFISYSILGRLTSATPTPSQLGEGNIIGTVQNPANPLLGPLADNGGPTLTHLPLAGSPAINAGDPDFLPFNKTDQRGVPRLMDGRVDIGAVELEGFVNQAPHITSPDAASVAENATAVLTVTATDPDLPPQTLAYSVIGGADGVLFEFTSGGMLAFKSAQDYEMPGDANGDRVYLVDIRVDDGFGRFDEQTVTVTLTAVNDNNPVFASPAAVAVVEGSIPVLPVVATDADLPAQNVTFSIAGGDDAAKFEISPGGALSFVAPPSFEAPTDANGDNVYQVTVEASDGAGGKTSQAISVTVTADVPASADFNHDGVVDGVDLAIWRANFGTIGGPASTPGDADHDRDVDGADFLIWQRTLGPVAAPAAPSATSARSEETEAATNLSAGTSGLTLAQNVILGARLAPAAPPPMNRAARGPRGELTPRPAHRPPALLPWTPAPTAAWLEEQSPATSTERSDAVFADRDALDEILAGLV